MKIIIRQGTRFLYLFHMRKSSLINTKTQGGGGGGTLILSYIHRLRLFFWVQNFEFQYFLGFQKNEYCFGCEDFVDIYWDPIIRGSFLCILGSFLKVKVQNGSIFWAAKISNIVLWCLKFLLLFFVWGGGGEQ